MRFVKRPIVAASVNVAGIGYAIPGTVLALGLLSPLVLIDEAINAVSGRARRRAASASWSRDRAPPW